MNQLMETLFDLMNGPHSSEEERRAVRESAKAIQAVKDRLTLEEFDALWSATTDIENAGYLDSFALSAARQPAPSVELCAEVSTGIGP